MLYLDASAIVKLISPEAELPSLRAFLARAHRTCYTSHIAVTEVARALRAAGAAQAADRAVDPTGTLLRVPGLAIRAVPFDGALAVAASRLAPASALRSLDAIHVATALALGHSLRALITYDARMAHVAREAGLRVESPGAQLPSVRSPLGP